MWPPRGTQQRTLTKQAALTVRKETEMTGSLQIKNDKYYIIVNLKEKSPSKARKQHLVRRLHPGMAESRGA